MRVGFIGLGNIGTPMAQQIARAGFPLVVHDIRLAAAMEYGFGGLKPY